LNENVPNPVQVNSVQFRDGATCAKAYVPFGRPEPVIVPRGRRLWSALLHEGVTSVAKVRRLVAVWPPRQIIESRPDLK
jgi:hypothetical protein